MCLKTFLRDCSNWTAPVLVVFEMINRYVCIQIQEFISFVIYMYRKNKPSLGVLEVFKSSARGRHETRFTSKDELGCLDE